MSSKDSRHVKYEKHGYLIEEICQTYPHLSKELEMRILEFRMKFPVQYRDWYWYELVPATKKLQQRNWSHSTTPESFRKVSQSNHNGFQNRDYNNYGRPDQVYVTSDRNYHGKYREQQYRQAKLSESVSSRSQSRIIQGESPRDLKDAIESESCYKKYDLPHSISKLMSNRCVLVSQGSHLSASLCSVHVPHSEYLTNLEHLKELMPFEDKKSFYEYLQSYSEQTRSLSEKLLYQLVLLHLKLKCQTEPNDISEMLLNEYRKIQGDQFLNYKFPNLDSSRSQVVSRNQYVSRDSLSPPNQSLNENVMSREQFISQAQDSFSLESPNISREYFLSQDLAQNQNMSRDEFMSQDQTQNNFSSTNPVMTREQFISQDSQEQEIQQTRMSREQFISQDHTVDNNVSPSRQQFASQTPAMSREQYMSLDPENKVMSREEFITQARQPLSLFPGNDQTVPRNQFVSQDQNSVERPSHSLSQRVSNEDRIVHRLRKLLLNGSKHKALQCAIDHQDWVSASLIASSMDAKTFQSVCSMYVQSISKNDPLRTCLQVLFDLDIDYKYAEDWGIHLAAILNNVTDLSLVLKFGSILASVGDTCAQHVCYIAARLDPGGFASHNTKYVLLGTEKQPLEKNVPIRSIILTMAYDNNLLHLQYYKYYLALNYVKMGIYDLALCFLQNIANVVLRWKVSEVSTQYPLISYVYDLSLCIYSKVHSQPVEWINKLAELISNVSPGVQDYQKTDIGQDLSTAYTGSENIPQMLYSLPNYSSDSRNQFQVGSSQVSKSEPYVEPTPQYESVDQQSQVTPMLIPQVTSSVTMTNTSLFNPASFPSSSSESNQVPSFYVPNYEGISSQVGGYEPPVYTPPETSTQEQANIGEEESMTNINSISLTSKFTFGDDLGVEQKATNVQKPEFNSKESNSSNVTKAEPEKKSKKSSSNSSWLSFLNFAKPKNQMILPDDTERSIVWDEKKKKWVNVKDDDDGESEGPAAPPKASEIARLQPISSQNPLSSQNTSQNLMSVPVPSMTPSIGQNGPVPNFKMSAQNGARKCKAKYVNLLATNR